MAAHPVKLAFAGKHLKLTTAGGQFKAKAKPPQLKITPVIRFINHEPHILVRLLPFGLLYVT